MMQFSDRWFLILALAGCSVTAICSVAPAQNEEPAAADAADPPQPQNGAEPAPQPAQIDQWNDAHSMPRSDRFALSWWKLLILWLLIIIWIRSVDWVNRDVQEHDLGYGTWNAVVFFPFLAALLLFTFPLLLPIPSLFLLAVGVLLVGYFPGFIAYAVVRNKRVEPHERVFTPDWIRYELAQLGSKVGLKISAERKAEYEKGVPVDLIAVGAKEERDNQANLITARQSPGYLLVKEIVADMVTRRSDRLLLEYSPQSVVERHHIDGVWHNGEARDRESGDVMLAVMKTLSNLDMNERRKKQAGRFAAKYQGTSYMCPIVSQGVKTGERVMVDLLGGKQDELVTYEQLGMREKLAEQWSELMARDQGLLIISGMPEGGVTTLTDVSLMETDRLMRDFISVEEKHHLEKEVENIDVTTYDAAAGQAPAAVLVQVIRKYPNVIVVRDLVDPQSAAMLFKEVHEDRLVVTNVYAKDAAEALLRMLQKKVPRKEFASVVTAVINTRLIRKLCDQCKVAYEASPDLLKKLGIPAGKVEALYRAPKPEEIDKPCLKCSGVGFVGRTGLFELLIVSEKIRQVLAKQPQLELVRQAARASGMRTLQEEGILLVAKGMTSLQELQRVLKQ